MPDGRGSPTAAEIARAAAIKNRPKGAPVAPEETEEARDARKTELQQKIAEGGADAQAPGIVDLGDGDDGDEEDEPEGEVKSATPPFVKLPEGFVMPRGWIAWSILIEARHTTTPSGPDRWCVLWNLTAADEKLAAKRAGGDGNRIIGELAKQTIRVVGLVADEAKGIDGTGVKADWSGASGPGNVHAFWNAIGGKYRHALTGIYLKNHNFSIQENVRFFERCVFPRTVA